MRVRAPDGHVRVRHDSCRVRGSPARGRHGVDEPRAVSCERGPLGHWINNVPFLDAMVNDGLWDAYNQYHMGITGEIVAEKFQVTREEMDRFALESQRRAASATQEGRVKEQILPVDVPGAGRAEIDEGIRTDTSMEKLAKVPPVFREGGQVTAGNASQLSDGAAAMVVMSEKAADRHGVTPLARIVDYGTVGVKPELVIA